jgi:hypothetical protein
MRQEPRAGHFIARASNRSGSRLLTVSVPVPGEYVVRVHCPDTVGRQRLRETSPRCWSTVVFRTTPPALIKIKGRSSARHVMCTASSRGWDLHWVPVCFLLLYSKKGGCVGTHLGSHVEKKATVTAATRIGGLIRDIHADHVKM